jgi:DNA-binding NarL/FixJ family response regulator
MFKKVLVAEDVGSIGEGIKKTLIDFTTEEITVVQYCDDAYIKLKKAQQDGLPFDLLITDLSFAPDHRKNQISSGEQLLERVNIELPELKTIAFSINCKAVKSQQLMEKHGLNAYVCKGRNGLKHLRDALDALSSSRTYLSPQLRKNSRNSLLEIDDYDIRLLKLLANGLSKQEISSHFKEKQLSPVSISSIEKRQNKLLATFGAKNATHLISIVHGIGLI